MIAPNTLLQNRYLVQHQIGQGGMGAVYVATDQRFGSTVALKETFFDDPNLRKAFEREARLLNHLRHPALPRVSDHFAEEDGQFIVMEFIAGDDLAEKLKERGGAFPLSEVLSWADQLLDALDYLHTQEPPIIHRDIKPQNLKLTPRKHIVLLDFGLAKGTLAQSTTATKSVFGYSRHYAPLEQIQGAGTDPRSDLYSLAATLYHLMTGVIPPDALTRATAVLNGQPDPLLPANDVHAQVTPAVAEVVSKTMAQNAGQRPQSAAEMREFLREAARQVHGFARDTSALPGSTAANVYEQDTQLMFAAAPATRAGEGEGAEETGTVKGAGAAAATSVNPAAPTSDPASKGDTDPGSVVTRVAAKRDGMPRRRVIGIAASAAVLLAVVAAVYTFTSQPAPTPETHQQSVQTATPTPEASNTGKDESKEAEKHAEVEAPPVAAPPVPAASPVVIIRHKDKTPKGKQPDEGDSPDIDVDDDDTPEPPEVEEPPAPGRRAGRVPAPGTPEFEEYIKEQTRRATAAARRAERERRRVLIQRQAELERQRRQQQRQMGNRNQ
ncbi:MAG TPA: serine/threonine-protein kinase [Pyrinomonadaceae bacterium]|nr:serine/threonine-protein kinase [Pyrinomonadaceae bacterium]